MADSSFRRLPRALVVGLLVGAQIPAFGAADDAAKRKPKEIAAGESAAADQPVPAAQLDFFEKRIRPVLAERCYKCHSAEAEKLKGGLLLDTRAGIRKGGDEGPAVVPGDLRASLLIKAIHYEDEDFSMPPEKAGGKLTKEVIADFEQWVKMGAPDPRDGPATLVQSAALQIEKGRQFWSFRQVTDPPLPTVKGQDQRWMASPVDRFVLAKLEEKNLTPAPRADRRILIRRVTFDLTGLPPTPQEVESFLQDQAPNALEKVVDRLLASPHYGEHWGRHWLDVVRYADTAGCNSDYPIPDAYRYRNYVIASFNEDKPYDRFVREQIAGDLLPAKSEEERKRLNIATGYLAISRRYGSSDPEFHLTIEDTIDNVGKAILGLSVSCARCHDHKFDPILQADYYALYGIMASTRYAFPGMEDFQHQRDFTPLTTGPEAEALIAFQTELSALDHEQFRVKKIQKSLKLIAGAVAPAEPPVEAAAGESAAPEGNLDVVTAQLDTIKERIKALEEKALAAERAYAVSEGKPVNAQIHIKGDPTKLGAEVSRGFLQILGGQQLPATATGSGRYELAQWLTDPSNPLTARVMVNRIWQYHFDKGIAGTPNDFGTRGEPPTHPELLDYLTTRFVASGWSIKALHKLILLSNTYQMANVANAEAAMLDPNNNLLWKFDGRRLSAEEIRDAMLATSSTLDPTMGGAQPFPPEMKLKYTQHRPFLAVYETNRRSVYLLQQRRQKHPLLEVFDGADAKVSTAVRPVSTTPIQALFVMNDPFVHEQARHFAERLIVADPNTGPRIRLAYQLAFARLPTGEEIRSGESYLQSCEEALTQTTMPVAQASSAAWASYTRVLLSSNEFIFVD